MALRAIRKPTETQNSEIEALRAKLAAMESAQKAAAPAPEQEPAAPAPAASAPIATQSKLSPLAALLADNRLPVASVTALKAIVEKGSAPPALFPLIEVGAGPSGGLFVPSSRNAPELAELLPSGRTPLYGVFLAYRYEVLAWAQEFDGSSTAGPAWSGAFPASNVELVNKLIKASEAYQFTPKAARSAFDWPEGPGHIRPALQLLMYLAPIGNWGGGCAIVQTPWSAPSVTRSAENLLRYADPNNGTLPPFACSVQIETMTETNKAGTYSWKQHHLRIDALAFPGKPAEEVYVGFKNWYQALTEDEKSDFVKWVNGEDRKLPENVTEYLEKAISLKARV